MAGASPAPPPPPEQPSHHPATADLQEQQDSSLVGASTATPPTQVLHCPHPTTALPTMLLVLHDFDPSGWGDSYLGLQKGAMLTPCVPDEPIDGQGWAYGRDLASGRTGWYPPEFALLLVAL